MGTSARLYGAKIRDIALIRTIIANSSPRSLNGIDEVVRSLEPRAKERELDCTDILCRRALAGRREWDRNGTASPVATTAGRSGCSCSIVRQAIKHCAAMLK